MARTLKLQVERSDDEVRKAKIQEARLLELLIPVMGISSSPLLSRMTKCQEKGLLPGHLIACLEVLQFLTYTVLSAQKAQRLFGVRASVLLAMAMNEGAFDVSNLINSSPFSEYAGVCSLSPALDKWFLARARRLTADKRFRKAMSCAKDPKVYIFELFGLGYCDRLEALDLVDNIKSYDLEFCDRAGLLDIGQYRTAAFEEVCDWNGNLINLRQAPYFRQLSKDEGLDGPDEGLAAAS